MAKKFKEKKTKAVDFYRGIMEITRGEYIEILSNTTKDELLDVKSDLKEKYEWALSNYWKMVGLRSITGKDEYVIMTRLWAENRIEVQSPLGRFSMDEYDIPYLQWEEVCDEDEDEDI